MAIDEEELRQRLEAVAAHVSAPHFTVDGLVGWILRRRAKIIGVVFGSLLAVAAVAVAVPIGLGGGSRSPTTAPSTAPFRLSFMLAVNGQSSVFPQYGPPPNFVVPSGRNLRINVDVTVPPHATVTTLWLGISRDGYGTGRNGPTGVRPILARTRKPLTPGTHRFRLRWTVPTGLGSGTSLNLVATWTAGQSMIGQAIAGLVIPLNPRD